MTNSLSVAVLLALPYAKPRPAVEAYRLGATIRRAQVLERILRPVESAAYAAHAAARSRAFALCKIAVKNYPRYTVKLAKPNGWQLARPYQPIYKLISNAKHIGNFFKTHVFRIITHVFTFLVVFMPSSLSHFRFDVNWVS